MTPNMFPCPITEGSEIRLLEPHHAKEVFQLAERNRAHLEPWLPWILNTHSFADTRRFLYLAQRQHRANTGFHVGIWSGGALAGTAGMHPIDWPNRSVALGYWIDRGLEGKGLVTAACRRLIAHCFEELELHRVEIRCAVENHRSRAVATRLGFREEGTLREAQKVGERYLDMVVYAKLISEYGSQ